MEPIKPKLLSSNKITLPDNESAIQKSIPFSIGPKALYVQIMLNCTNLPAGTRISLTAPDPGPVPPISIFPTFVTMPNFSLGIMSNVPTGYSTQLNLAVQMPAGQLSSSNMSVAVNVSQMSD